MEGKGSANPGFSNNSKYMRHLLYVLTPDTLESRVGGLRQELVEEIVALPASAFVVSEVQQVKLLTYATHTLDNILKDYQLTTKDCSVYSF